MKFKKFEIETDFDRLETFLKDQYLEHRNASSWLPVRLHDLIYRCSAREEEDGDPMSRDYIYLCEEEGDIAACILPDGENIYYSVPESYADRFPEILAFSETCCRPLFPEAEDGSVKLWLAIDNDRKDLQAVVRNAGYMPYSESEYYNIARPGCADTSIVLPAGFRFCYGEDYPNEDNKWTALSLGFHPDRENTGYHAGMHDYNARKQSAMYTDSFECLVLNDEADDPNIVCSYCFVFVDLKTKLAMIEPVSTREKYQHKGLGTAMIHGALARLKDLGVEKCYVDAFGSRKDFYRAAGFSVESSVGFWSKKIGGSAQ